MNITRNIINKFLGISTFLFPADDLQTISPITIGRPSLRGFGVSFSSHPHQDVDKNELEDLAIGIVEYIFHKRFSRLILHPYQRTMSIPDCSLSIFRIAYVSKCSHFTAQAISVGRVENTFEHPGGGR